MSGIPRPDPAFLHNVPTSLPSSLTLSSLSASSTVASVLSSSITSATRISPTASATASASSEAGSIYFYSPSTALAIVFSVLYALLVPYHFYHSIYTPLIAKTVSQKHKYTIPLLVACGLSTTGYSLRVVSVSSESSRSSVGLYAASQTWVVLSPIFVCATLYLLVTHLINLCLPNGPGRVFLGVSPRWLGRVFIASDILSFLCQGGGSGIAASNNWTGKEEDIGSGVLIFGLVAQLVTFTVFLAVFTLFCLRVRSGKAEEKRAEVQVIGLTGNSGVLGDGVEENDNGRDFGFNPLVKQVVKGMWIASIFVEIRSIYRTIEFAMGVEGYLFQHEWVLWVFEAAPMWFALLALGYFHPVKWLQQKRRSAFVDKHDRNVGGRLPR